MDSYSTLCYIGTDRFEKTTFSCCVTAHQRTEHSRNSYCKLNDLLVDHRESLVNTRQPIYFHSTDIYEKICETTNQCKLFLWTLWHQKYQPEKQSKIKVLIIVWKCNLITSSSTQHYGGIQKHYEMVFFLLLFLCSL